MTREEPIHAIQLLRFLAALAVAVLHARIVGYWTGRQLGYDLAPPDFAGGAGVDVFFAISGFVMVHAMRGRFGMPRARREFLIRRLIRIVPPYWLATSALVVWGFFYPPKFDLLTLVTSYLFVPYPSLDSNGRIVPYLEPGWTLNLEMLFYLVFAVCMAASAARTVLGAVLVLLGLVLLHQIVGPVSVAAQFWTQPLLIEFGFGMGLGLLYDKIVLPKPVAGALALAGLALLAASPPAEVLGADSWARLQWYGVPGAALVAAAALARWRLPFARACDVAGNVSYALYLWHLPALFFVARAHGALSLPVAHASFTALGLLLALPAAWLSWAVFERPVLAWLRGKFAVEA